jgi:anti-sigma B factor antagonist
MMPGHEGPAVREREVNGVIVLSVEKELKGEGESALRERLDGLVREGQLQILIDLRDVPYMDSTELGRLIRAHLSVRRAGGRVRLCNLSDKVMTVMKLTRLDTVLEIFGTEEEGLEAFHRPDPQGARLPSRQAGSDHGN